MTAGGGLPELTFDVPQDVNAEMAVLGGMLRSKDVIADVVEILRADDFYRPAHSRIFLAVLELYGSEQPADVLEVAAVLTKSGELDQSGGLEYLRKLPRQVKSIASIESHARAVREASIRRRLVEAAMRIDITAHSDADIDDVINLAQAEVTAATHRSDALGSLPIGDALEDALDFIETVASLGMQGIPTGFEDLDALTGGFQPGQLVVVASRAAMGKTSLALSFARTCAIRHRIPAAYFSLEDSLNETNLKILSAEARVALHHLRAGSLTGDDWTRLARVVPQLNEAPLFLDDSLRTDLTEIRAKCRRLRSQHGIRLVVVDYLQLLPYGLRQFASRYEEINEISRHLKIMAKELDLTVIAVSQLNRGPEQRTDKRPMLFDLRDSGTLEEDADIVLLLHREDAYERESPRAGEADVIVAKARHSPTATITVAYQGHYSRFVEMGRPPVSRGRDDGSAGSDE